MQAIYPVALHLPNLKGLSRLLITPNAAFLKDASIQSCQWQPSSGASGPRERQERHWLMYGQRAGGYVQGSTCQQLRFRPQMDSREFLPCVRSPSFRLRRRFLWSGGQGCREQDEIPERLCFSHADWHSVARSIVVHIPSIIICGHARHSQAEVDASSTHGGCSTQEPASHLLFLGIVAARVVRVARMPDAGYSNMRDALEVHWEALLHTREAHVRSFDAHLLNRDHERTDELVAACKTKTLVLPIGLVEEDDVERHVVHVDDFTQLRENFALVFALFDLHELQQFVAQTFNLVQCGSEFDGDGHSFCLTSRAALVQNKKAVKITVRSLYNLSLHFLELRIQQTDFLNKVVVTKTPSASVTIYTNTVAHIEGMFGEYEDDRLQELLGEVSTPAAEVEIREMNTRSVMTTTMNMKTSSSLPTTESRSFNDAVMDLRSRPISTHTASSSSIEMSPFISLSNMLKAASASSSFSKASRKSSAWTVFTGDLPSNVAKFGENLLGLLGGISHKCAGGHGTRARPIRWRFEFRIFHLNFLLGELVRKWKLMAMSWMMIFSTKLRIMPTKMETKTLFITFIHRQERDFDSEPPEEERRW
ncbi:hypothetical protein KC322_g104 [Hortaea werneckii]|nr:hypothetical protein KC322_g104 [Hortaea werneckii]